MTMKQLKHRAGEFLAGDYLYSRDSRIAVLVTEREGKLMAQNGYAEGLGLGWHEITDSFLRKLGL